MDRYSRSRKECRIEHAQGVRERCSGMAELEQRLNPLADHGKCGSSPANDATGCADPSLRIETSGSATRESPAYGSPPDPSEATSRSLGQFRFRNNVDRW